MRKQTNPNIKAHLLRSAFYLLLFVAVGVIPFALAQRATTKQSAVAHPHLLASTPGATLSNSDCPATWSLTGSLNTGGAQHTATLLPNGKVLVAGGAITGGASTSAELYDPSSGSWTTTGSLNTGRYEHTATLLPNGKVLASAELYDPASGTWTTRRRQHGHRC